MIRLNRRWLAQFTCEYYTRLRVKPSIGDTIKHPDCGNPECCVTKVRDRDKQPDLPQIH